MSPILKRNLDVLQQAQWADTLRDCRHGIEKESLRISADGHLAMTSHPRGLGSALTHPYITTDYSEALLELITPVCRDVQDLLHKLDDIHRYTYSQIGDEWLWTESMPCRLPATDNEIPIAWYGSSNVGTLKHVYRRGLAVRYGKAMQCIAGIHYNFSLSPALWQVLQQSAGDQRPPQEWQSASYFGMIRNFRRYSWLLMYLFGASPALCSTFLRGREHNLQPLGEKTLYLPWATSLRMSDLGYNNNAQAGLNICYNSLDNYIQTMTEATGLPYAPYARIGTHDADGNWQQLNTNLLQIENEFYSPIRPKRVAQSGEKPVHALAARGVEYIEVRCLDIDPFEPLGISLQTARFLDVFLLYCALEESPPLDQAECLEVVENFALSVRRGREPGLLLHQHGVARPLTAWGQQLVSALAPCAALLDQVHGGTDYSASLQAQAVKLADPALTPSARVLAGIAEHGDSFFRFALAQSEAHQAYFADRPLPADQQAAMQAAAEASLAEQAEIEASDTLDFDAYVAAYMAQELPG